MISKDLDSFIAAANLSLGVHLLRSKLHEKMLIVSQSDAGASY